jgi:hypothetical protein
MRGTSVQKSVSFSANNFDEIRHLMDTRNRSFSEVVNFLVRLGVQAYEDKGRAKEMARREQVAEELKQTKIVMPVEVEVSETVVTE